jgi:hypothetical protein
VGLLKTECYCTLEVHLTLNVVIHVNCYIIIQYILISTNTDNFYRLYKKLSSCNISKINDEYKNNQINSRRKKEEQEDPGIKCGKKK